MAKKKTKKAARSKIAAKKVAKKKKGRSIGKRAPSATKKKPNAIPAGFHTVTPAFRVVNCAKAIDFMKQAFGAKEKDRYDGPGGQVMHCELMIGDSVIMCGDVGPDMPQPLIAALYVKDADSVFQRALDAGATVKEPMTNKFYGDRSGSVRDPFGNEWSIATHVEDVSPKEMQRRMAEMGG